MVKTTLIDEAGSGLDKVQMRRRAIFWRRNIPSAQPLDSISLCITLVRILTEMYPLYGLSNSPPDFISTCLKIGRRTILTEEISAFISDLLHLQISFPQRGRQKRNHGVETGQELAPIFVQFFGGSSYIYHPSRWSQCQDKAAALWRHSKREQIVTHCNLELATVIAQLHENITYNCDCCKYYSFIIMISSNHMLL